MPPITQWNPATVVSRGNVKVGIVPATVSMSAPKLTELDATTGAGLDCSITTFNATSTTDSQTVDWLCTPVSEQLPGSTSHSMDDLTIKVSGQTDTALHTALAVGSVVYLWRRDGLPATTALATTQEVWLWKVRVTSIDPTPTDSAFIGIVAHVSVIERTAKPVAITT